MRLLRKLFRREKSHEEWLAEHPDKASTKYVPQDMSAEESQRMRSQMEAELDAQRTTREQP